MSRSSLDNFLKAAFNIEEGEAGKAAWMWTYLFFAVGGFVIGRITRDTLFMIEGGDRVRDMLAHMYYVAPLSVSAAAWLYSRFADKFRRDHVIQATTIFLGCGLLFLATFGATQGTEAFYIGLYIYVEIMGMFLTLQFWTFANDVIDSRQGKRLFGVIGTGGVVAAIIAGQVVRSAKNALGVGGLLFLCVGCLMGVLVCVYIVARSNRQSLNAALQSPRTTRSKKKGAIKVGADSGKLLSTPYLKLLGLMVIATFLTSPIIDYQWKVVAAHAHDAGEIDYAAYMGNFYTLTGVFSFFFQLFATRRILKRFGIFVALLVLPVSMGGGSLMNVLIPGIIMVSLAKGSEMTFRYTINDSTVALLYLPIPAHQRGRVKAFIDGILKFWAIAFSGMLLAWVVKPMLGDNPHQLSYVALLTLITWLVTVVWIKREYLDTLLSGLKGRSLDLGETSLDVGDESTARAVSRALRSEDEGQVLRALDILPQLGDLRFDDDVAALLQNPSNNVQMAAVREIGRIGSLRHAASIKTLFHDDSEEVRAAAIDAYCAIGREKAIRDVNAFLGDDNPAIKAAAIVGLIKYGGLDGVLCAAEELKLLIHHSEPQMRLQAARVLGAIGVRNFYQPLLGLLSDPVREVQLEAIEAAGQMRSPELIPALIMKLRKRTTARAATESLAEYGAGVEPLLGKVLRFSDEDPEVRAAAPGILARIDTQEACDVLQRCLGMEEANPALRYKVHRSLARLTYRNPQLRVDRKRVRAACIRELRHIYQELQVTADLAEAAEFELLSEALHNRREVMLHGVFHLLSVLYPDGQMDTVYGNLHSNTPAVRANALEVVDNLVEKGLREHLLNLQESRSIGEQLAIGEELGVTQVRSRNERLAELLRQEDPWVVACCLDAVKRISGENAALLHPELLALAHEALARDDTLIRQSALWCLYSVAPNDEKVLRDLREHAGEHEPDDIVRNFARDALAQLTSAPTRADAGNRGDA